jgi:hypothetical protein
MGYQLFHGMGEMVAVRSCWDARSCVCVVCELTFSPHVRFQNEHEEMSISCA